MNEVYGVIYCATNTINDKKYIGQTIRGLQRRKNEHICLAKNGSDWAFQQAIREYGEDAFEWQIIDKARDQEELNVKEIHWIELYNTFYEGGYNMAVGGQYNLVGTDDEVSLSRGGRPFYVYDLKGQFVKETISQKAFAEEINVYPQTVNNVLLGIKNQAKGFIMIFKDVFSEQLLRDRLEQANFKNKAFAVFNKSGDLIGIWDNKIKCSEEIALSLRSIQEQLARTKPIKRVKQYLIYYVDRVPNKFKHKIRM